MNPPIARQLNLDETKLPAEIFERLSRRGATLKDYRRRREEAIENFGKPGRDPAELGSVMTTIAGHQPLIFGSEGNAGNLADDIAQIQRRPRVDAGSVGTTRMN